MPADEPQGPQTDRRRCPVCWTWFTPNSPSNPYPRRYCCGACRIEDSRRRRERKQTQLLLDAKLDVAPQDTPRPSVARPPEPDAHSTKGQTP
jgi:hypothetical protein